MLRFRTQKMIAAVMIASAIFVPAANARPIDAPGLADTPRSAQAHELRGVVPLGAERTASGANPATRGQPSSLSSSFVTSSDGFHWGDAAIGAAATLLLLSLGAGVVVTIRRSRGGGQPAMTT